MDALVNYSGGREGIQPSTWGQYSIWSEMRQIAPYHHRYNVPVSVLYKKPVKVSAALGAVHHALSVYESLRTRFRPAADGGLDQVLHADIQIPVRLVNTSYFRDIAPEAMALRQSLADEPFDAAADWPVRIGLVVHNGLAYCLEAAVSHLSVDGQGVPALHRTLAGSPPGEAWLQPIDEARFQRSPAGERINSAAEKYWRGVLQQAPREMFGQDRSGSRAPDHQIAALTSPALPAAVDFLSKKMQIGSSAVLLAAFSLALSRVSGCQWCVMLVQSHNRSRAQLRHSVSTLAMPGLFLVKSDETAFPEMIRRTWPAVLAAYHFSYYDKRRIDQVRAAVERDRGGRIDLSCWLNDRRSAAAQAPPADLNAADIRRRLRLTRLDWLGSSEKHSDATVGMRIYDPPEAIKLEVIADAAALSRLQVEFILREIESLIIQEVISPPPARCVSHS